MPHRVAFPAIARILQQPDCRVRGRVLAHAFRGSVSRTVIDDDYLDEFESSADILQDRIERTRKTLFFVVGRDNDRKREQLQILPCVN